MQSLKTTARLRNYCFTYHLTESQSTAFNESKDANLEFLKSFISDDSGARFAIWQLESAPETGALHLQGYVEFTTPMRLSAVKRLLGKRLHLEARNGTRAQAIDYCRKEATRIAGPWYFGDEGGVEQGKRNDLLDVGKSICEGRGLSSVVEDRPDLYIRYRRGFEGLVAHRDAKVARTFREVDVRVYYGDAGSGKTRRAVEDGAESMYVLDQSERVWFDGYNGDSTLVIDDFYGWIKYGQLLRILDGHIYRCEIKGGFTYALWTTVILTSNKHPSEWYSHGMTAALKRRITSVLCFNMDGTTTDKTSSL